MLDTKDVENDPEFQRWVASRRSRDMVCVECGAGYTWTGYDKPNGRSICDDCLVPHDRRRLLLLNGGGHPSGLCPGTLGALNELRACADLMARGGHVFRALSPNCPCDLTVMFGERVYRVEVKTRYIGMEGSVVGIPKPDDVDVMAYVIPSGRVYYIPDLFPPHLSPSWGEADVEAR